MGSRSHNPMLTSMIQDAILKLCTQNMTFSKSLEIDGIICVSQGEQLPDVVVKMHRTIVKPPVNQEQPSVANSWTYADNTFQGNTYPQVNTLTPQTTQNDFTDQTLTSNTSYSTTPRIAENLNMTPSTSKHDTPQTQLQTYEHTLPEATQVTPGGSVAKDVTNIKVEASTNKRSTSSEYATEDPPPKKQLKQEIKEEPITLDLDDEDDLGGYDEDGGGGDMGDGEAGNSWMPDDSLDTSATDQDYTLDDSQLEGDKQTTVVGPVVECDRAASDAITKTVEQITPTLGKKRKRAYNKYTPEQKAEICRYAREFGSTAAAKHFSKQWNMDIDESSVRNFKSVVIQKSPAREKKRKKAYKVAAEHFSKQYNMDIEDSVVQKYESVVIQKTRPPGKKRKNNKYTPEQRAEMGKYAREFGNTAAAKHFSAQYNMKIDESSVRTFKSEVEKRLKCVDLEDIECIETSNRGRPTLLPADIESELFQHVETLRASGKPVNGTVIHSALREIIQRKDKKLLFENGGHIAITRSLVRSLSNRMGLSKNV